MKEWEELEPRERDAWVAERLFGWRWFKSYAGNAKFLDIPTAEGRSSFCGTERADDSMPLTLCTDYHRLIPKYSQLAGDDYEVLVKAREWPREGHNRFCDSLRLIWTDRGYDEFEGAAYQPGDYSHAAYDALWTGD